MSRFLQVWAVAVWMAFPAAAAVAVERLPAAEFTKRAVAPHRGRVVLVNFWATWCDPCVEELPGMVRAAKKAGVDLVTVSLDTGKDLSPVRSFLFKVGAGGPAFVASMSDPEQFINAIDASWDGTVPYTLVYDASGALVARLRGMQSEAEVARAIAVAQRSGHKP